MLHFDMKNGIAIIDATTALTIPKLLEVHKKFKGLMRDKVFTYIHICSRLDPQVPFFTAEEDEIRELSKQNYFNEEFPFPDAHAELIETALQKYKEAFDKPEVRILKLFDDKIDQIKNIIRDTKPKIVENTNPTTGAVTFSSNIEIITKSMEKIDGLLVAKARLEAKIRNESEGKGTFRGGKKPSRLEAKSIRDKI